MTSLFAVLVLASAEPASCEDLRLIARNSESDDADIQYLTGKVGDQQVVELWGFSDVDAKGPIATANGFRMREIVVTGAGLELDDDPTAEAPCGLVLWYDDAADSGRPLLAEFPFRYGAEGEKFSKDLSLRAYDVFAGI